MASSNPFKAYFLNIFKFKYAHFTGRARRSEFWYFALFHQLFITAILAGFDMLGFFTGLDFLAVIVLIIYILAAFIPNIAITIRRLHDTGKSGWWLLVSLVPFIGWIILIYFMVQDSQPFDNQYGPNPKSAPFNT